MRIRRNKTILEQAADYVEAAVEKAGPILADAKDKAGEVLSDARDQAGPVLSDAKDKAGELLSDARQQAGPVLSDARDKASPLIAQSAALAAEKASQGKELASTKVAELTGKPPKKKHRLRKLLILTGIAAALGFVAKKLTSRGSDDGWQSSYTPQPAPRDADRTDSPISEKAADEGGAGPDEALADATDESHAVTTPDEPAEVVDVAPGEEPVEKDAAKP